MHVSRMYIAVCCGWIHLGYMHDTCIEGKQTLLRGKTAPYPQTMDRLICFIDGFVGNARDGRGAAGRARTSTRHRADAACPRSLARPVRPADRVVLKLDSTTQDRFRPLGPQADTPACCSASLGLASHCTRLHWVGGTVFEVRPEALRCERPIISNPMNCLVFIPSN